MAVIESNPSIWEEIERSESYLVCSMYSEAESLASSILKRVCKYDDKSIVEVGEDDVGFRDVLESTGMVLVQSLKALGRTSEILNQLKLLYVSVTAIPVQVLLTGACFQISDGSSFGVREFLEEFLSKWNCVDERYYVLVGAEANLDCMARSERHYILGVYEYVEVVEVYAVTLLATVLQDMHLAISWVLLRKLHSLHSLKATNLSQGSSPLPADNHDGHLSSQKELNVSEGSQKALKATYPPNQGNVTKQEVLKLSERMEPYFWWFRTITFKFGNARLVISNGKIMLGCLILLMFYVLRRKKAALKRTVTRQALFLKGALVDLWKLAFSYQVNPLAAVQPLATATRGQESYEFMEARPWQEVNEFYTNTVNGHSSLSALFGIQTHHVHNNAEIPEVSDKPELESVSAEDRTGRWARSTFKIVLSYHGGSFDGWQKQPGLNTVQGLIEISLGKFVDENKVKLLKDKGLPLEGCVVVAGRTDKGVTALQQNCAFSTWRRDIKPRDIGEAINSAVPGKLRVISVSEVSRIFHPNFSAKWRRYLYIFPLNDWEDGEQNSESGEDLEHFRCSENEDDQKIGRVECNGETFENQIINDGEELESGKKPRNFRISRVNQLLQQLEGKLLSYKMFARDTKASRSV
ncbi:hypothetical protein SO802_029837 [Lithocarpus litseifolius]|uniref:Uncharacterized protein n=1 Tax=Lithocarpus litseifolius TaxID=425828 RepID=A0AAW2BWH1_9ROSI